VTPEAQQAMREALRRALATADLPSSLPEHPGPMVPPVSSPPPDDLVARFTTELEALAGRVHRLTSVEAIAALVIELLAREGSSQVLAWDDSQLPVAGLTGALERAGLTVHHQRPEGAQDSATRHDWAAAGVGITGAAACLALTGSIVVVSGRGRGRLASLLPPIHVALVRRAMFRESLQTLLAEQPDLPLAGANMVCITGTSRTADIEHVLCRGVHGPREVHVVIVD
jgi:L-lactate dehydrogenase complex protein LldG